MKTRASSPARSRAAARPRRSELKGVVKKIAGKLTSDPHMEREGREEMLGRDSRTRARTSRSKAKLNPDPHRRG